MQLSQLHFVTRIARECADSGTTGRTTLENAEAPSDPSAPSASDNLLVAILERAIRLLDEHDATEENGAGQPRLFDSARMTGPRSNKTDQDHQLRKQDQQ